MNLQADEIKKLYYEKGMSAREVGEMLGASPWQIIRFMQKNDLPRRDQAETHQIAFLAKPPSFKAKRTLTIKEKELKTAGLMLYWGEGSKIGNYTIDLANSNPLIIQLFLKMLRKIYGINENRLRVLLYCYPNQNTNYLINYWVNVTGIPSEQFSKPYVRKDFLEEKKNRMIWGLVHIRYNDKKLVARIKSDIEEVQKKFI